MYRQAVIMIASVVLLSAANTSALVTGYASRMMSDMSRSPMDDQQRTGMPYSQSFKDMQSSNSLTAEQRTGISSAASRVMADQVLRASAEDLQRSGVASAATRSLVDQVLRDSVEDHLKRSGMPSNVARSAADQVFRSAMDDKMMRSGMSSSAAHSVADQVLRDAVEDQMKRTGVSHAAARSIADQVSRRVSGGTPVPPPSRAEQRTAMENKNYRSGVDQSISDQILRSMMDSQRYGMQDNDLRSVMDNQQRYGMNDKDLRRYMEDQDQRSGMSSRSMADQYLRASWQRQEQDY